ncbi:MAG: 3D domain-containing protein [Acidobacteria bacterium]|nr:3D domain-containing protein [Acidobacteriota bacterium]
MRRVISRSRWRKVTVTVVAIVGFVLLYEVSMFDSRQAAPQGPVDPTLPAPGTRQLFTATAYCKGTTTASGVGVRTGIAASDPAILPVGSVINVTAGDTKYNGVYTIMDTGPKVQGRLVDLYMWSCQEALAFGRQQIAVTVLRLGWNPSASTPSLIDRLFRRREAAPTTAPAAAAPDSGANGVDGAKGATEPFGDAAETGSEGSHPAPSDAPVAPTAPVAPLPGVAPAASAPR